MEIVLNGELFKTLFKGIVEVTSEARFHFSDNGLHSRAVDPANVAMVIVDIPRDSFDAYSIDEETTVGVDINRIYDIAKSIKKNELVELKIEDESMKIKFGSVNYTLSLIDPSAIRKEPKIPNLELSVKVIVDGKEFKRVIQLVNFADAITLTVDSQHPQLIISAKDSVISFEAKLDSQFKEDSEGDLKKDLEENFERNLERNVKSSFGIEYVKQFLKFNDILEIGLGDNLPGIFTYKLRNNSKISYIIAPRIKEEW